MTILLNKWDGQKFENQVICTRCGSKTAVKKVMGDAQYCKGCLLDFVTDIDCAVLSDKCAQTNLYRPEARREGN